MKRALLTLLAALLFLACQAQKAKVFPHGIKVLGNTQITTVGPNDRILILNDEKISEEISLADFEAQLNISGGDISAHDSPVQGIKFWIGDKVDFAGRTPLDSVFYYVRDSTPSLPSIIMTKPVYDTDENSIVDLAETVPDDAITNPKLANNSVGTNEIQPDAITNSKMANNAIGSPETINNSLLLEDLATEVFQQGTFPPSLIGSASGTYTTTGEVGTYIKWGDFVFFKILFVTVDGSAPVGNLRVEGLPFLQSGPNSFVNVMMSGGSVDFYSILGSITNDYIDFIFQGSLDNSNSEVMSNVDFTAGTIWITGFYTAQ